MRAKPHGGGERPVGLDDTPLEEVIRIANFRAALREFLQHSEQAARSWGLTPQRYLLLLAIKGAPDGSERLRFIDVAERLKLSRNTVSELSARAEQLGLITREPSLDDARSVYLRLTKEGESRLAGALAEHERYRHELAVAFQNLAETFHAASGRRTQRHR